MINELSQEAYLSTMSKGMIDVTENAEPVMDIWPYVRLLHTQGLIPVYVIEHTLVEKVYRSKDGRYDHVLLPDFNKNIFFVILMDNFENFILGHYRLNLNCEYGLS